MTNKTAITLYGNVGGDPETRTIPGKQVTKQFYDPIIDDMIEREFTTPEREVRTFSIAVSSNAEGSHRFAATPGYRFVFERPARVTA